MRRVLRWVGWTVLCLALMALIIFNMLVVWVATGPRSLKEYIPVIEARINDSQDLINVKVDDIALVWDGWQHPIDTRLRQLKVYNKKNILLASFEQVSSSANLTGLLHGELWLNSLVLHSPVINLYRKMDGSYTMDLGQDLLQGPELPKSTPQTPIQPLAKYAEQMQLGMLASLNKLEIKNGTLNIGDTRRGILLTMEQANISFKRVLTHLDMTLAANIRREDEQGGIYIQSNIPFDSFAAISKITLDQFKPTWIASLHEDLNVLRGANVPISGWVNVSLNEQGKLVGGSLRVSARQGEIISDQLEGVLPVESVLVEGKLSKQGVLVLNSIQLLSDGVEVNAQANLWRNEKDQLGIKLNGSTGAVPTERIRNFWPLTQSPESRDWVVTNLSKGRATDASIEVNIRPGDLELPRFPKDSIHANINFEKLNVRYMPEHAEATNVSGNIYLNADALTATIANASYLTGTKIFNGKVYIGDLLADNPLIEVSINADAPAVDIATFLAYPDLALTEPLGMTKENVKGSAKGKASVAFSFYAPRDKQGRIIEDEMVKYEVSATLNNVSQTGFLKKYDITNATGELKVDKSKLTFEGVGEVFGDKLNTSVTHYFKPKEVETHLTAKGVLTTETLQKMNVNITDYVRGTIPVDGLLNQAPSGDIHLKAAVDLADTDITIQEIDWQKARAVPAKASFELNAKGDVIDVQSIDFSTQDSNVVGSMQFNNSKLTALRASTFKIAGNDLALEYMPIPGGFSVSAMGAKADLKPWFKKDDTKQEKDSFSDIPAMDLKLNIASAILDEDRMVNDLKGVMRCDPKICQYANITGNFDGGKPFSFTIAQNGGRRNVRILSEDAGAFLKGLDVYDNMEGGKLDINGTFNDASAQHPLTGKAFVWDFQLHNTPVLSRIVSLASFGGILDALAGKGIVFDKLKSDYVLTNDIIEVKDLGTVGGSIGISADGTIDTKRNVIDLKGTVVPANTINSLLKNVPIVGEILTGGEGIIAAVYTVKGNMDDPDVSVNPLSVLAPGFLRKMFE